MVLLLIIVRNFFGTADPFAADGMGDSPFGMGGMGGMPFMSMHGAGGRGMGMNGSSMGGGGREAGKHKVRYNTTSCHSIEDRRLILNIFICS